MDHYEIKVPILPFDSLQVCSVKMDLHIIEKAKHILSTPLLLLLILFYLIRTYIPKKTLSILLAKPVSVHLTMNNLCGLIFTLYSFLFVCLISDNAYLISYADRSKEKMIINGSSVSVSNRYQSICEFPGFERLNRTFSPSSFK